MRGVTTVHPVNKIIVVVSIHTPHAGCDFGIDRYAADEYMFQSTHPMRGVTYLAVVLFLIIDVSIHTPHAGCD